jgi:hypothetical protein
MRTAGAGRAAAVLTWVYAAGFGIPAIPVSGYLLSHGSLPWFLDLFPMYGGPWSSRLSAGTFVALLAVFLVVTGLAAWSAWWLWQGRKVGALVNLALLPVEAIFWVGFALPGSVDRNRVEVAHYGPESPRIWDRPRPAANLASWHNTSWSNYSTVPGGRNVMRNAYKVFAYIVAAEVAIQAMVMVWAIAGLVKWVDGGGVFDKSIMESEATPFTEVFGIIVHAINGTFVIPALALVLLILSFFTKVRGAIKWAAIVFVLVVAQGQIGYLGHEFPFAGALHGLNALALFGAALYTGRRIRTAASSVVEEQPEVQAATPV